MASSTASTTLWAPSLSLLTKDNFTYSSLFGNLNLKQTNDDCKTNLSPSSTSSSSSEKSSTSSSPTSSPTLSPSTLLSSSLTLSNKNNNINNNNSSSSQSNASNQSYSPHSYHGDHHSQLNYYDQRSVPETSTTSTDSTISSTTLLPSSNNCLNDDIIHISTTTTTTTTTIPNNNETPINNNETPFTGCSSSPSPTNSSTSTSPLGTDPTLPTMTYTVTTESQSSPYNTNYNYFTSTISSLAASSSIGTNSYPLTSTMSLTTLDPIFFNEISMNQQQQQQCNYLYTDHNSNNNNYQLSAEQNNQLEQQFQNQENMNHMNDNNENLSCEEQYNNKCKNERMNLFKQEKNIQMIIDSNDNQNHNNTNTNDDEITLLEGIPLKIEDMNMKNKNSDNGNHLQASTDRAATHDNESMFYPFGMNPLNANMILSTPEMGEYSNIFLPSPSVDLFDLNDEASNALLDEGWELDNQDTFRQRRFQRLSVDLYHFASDLQVSSNALQCKKEQLTATHANQAMNHNQNTSIPTDFFCKAEVSMLRNNNIKSKNCTPKGNMKTSLQRKKNIPSTIKATFDGPLRQNGYNDNNNRDYSTPHTYKNDGSQGYNGHQNNGISNHNVSNNRNLCETISPLSGVASNYSSTIVSCDTSKTFDNQRNENKIGIYSPKARKERIQRFLEKRKTRVWQKRIKYDCRKTLAAARPRYKGRFVKVDETVSVASLAAAAKAAAAAAAANANTNTATNTNSNVINGNSTSVNATVANTNGVINNNIKSFTSNPSLDVD